MKNLVQATLVILATATGLWVLWHFRGTLTLFLLALILATLLAPPSEFLHRHGVPRSLAIGLTYVAALLTAMALLAVVGGYVLRDLKPLVGDVNQAYQYIDRHWPEGNAVQRYVARQLPPMDTLPQQLAKLANLAFLSELLGIGGSLAGVIVNGFLMVVISIYLRLDYPRLEQLWLLLFPQDHRLQARGVWRDLQAEVGAYMRSELLQSFLAGVVLAVSFCWGGFPYPVATAVVAAAMWLVPWLGPPLAVAVVCAASALNFSDVTPVAQLIRSGLASGLTLLLFAALEWLVEPRLLGSRQRYSSLLIVLVTLTMIWLAGPAAIVIGPPIAVAIQIMANQLLFLPGTKEAANGYAELRAMREQICPASEPGAPRRDQGQPALESIVQRLDELLADAEKLLAPPGPPPAGPAAPEAAHAASVSPLGS
jgi:predicted PurR-regulated permease PerM